MLIGALLSVVLAQTAVDLRLYKGVAPSQTNPIFVKLSDGTTAVIVTVGGAIKVDGSAVTQPVSGTVTAQGVDSTGTARTIATTPTGAVYVMQAQASPPLNPFLQRCNAVRRSNCQP